MQLLRKVWSFGSSKEEMVHSWKTFCRGILEQTCVLWDSSLTQQNRTYLERTQKNICKACYTRRVHKLQNCLAHRSNLPPYLISHGKLVYTFKYVHMNFPKKGNMCHRNIISGTRISLIGNYLQGGSCISISPVVELAQGRSATNGATPSSLLQIVTANFPRRTFFFYQSQF